MSVILYDLVGVEDRRFSPHCWRTRMALAHKGLECEARPTRFGEIGTIAGGRFKTIPVIEDQGRQIVDSWAIARYLEETYPDRPSLFGGPGGEALSRFVQNWCVGVLHAGIASMIVLDICEHLLPEEPGEALRPLARAGAGRPRDAGRGFSQEPGAAAADRAGGAVPGRRTASLCRLCGVRRFSVGTHHQPVPAARAG
jgi:hypothetical protein